VTTAPVERRAFAPVAVLTAAGWSCIVLGGLVAAVTGPLTLADGSWLAAYLVLVGGVAQVAMGVARMWCGPGLQPNRWAWTQVGTWNAGNAAVIGGTVVGGPLMVDLGSLLLFVAVAIALHAARPSAVRSGTGGSGVGSVPRPVYWPVYWGYRALLVVLLISIPVGMVLSHARHG